MGDDLQEIVRTNGLRPGLEDPNCYEEMINNVASYFRSMTDPSAEHDAFGEMIQGPDESVMKFVARLRSKVSACGYHADDEERFVRSQFLKGMLDQGLAQHARIHNQKLGELVNNAHRAENLAKKKKETLNKETQARESFAVESWRSSGRGQDHRGRAQNLRDRDASSQRYRRGLEGTRGYIQGPGDTHEHGRGFQDTRRQSSRGRNEGGPWLNRSSSARGPTKHRRCPNCNKDDHGGQEPCPAAERKCWRCDGVGHFASACHPSGSKKFARQIERENSRDQV